MQTRRLTITILLLVAFPVLPRAVAAAELRPVASIEGIAEYRLDNGLKVLLFPDSSKPKVTVNLTIFVGSRHEGYGEAGMAHLLEHMMFKGTPKHQDIPKALKDRGARMNGSTWLDRTNYFETLPATDENLEFAIRLEADRLVNSLIRGEDLASEMTVVRNEFEAGENRTTSILYQRILAAAFLWHNYGQSTIGNRADIERVPVERLRAFYEKHYRPDNSMVVVAGQFDRDKAIAHIQKYFGAIPRPEQPLDKTYTEEPAQDGERLVTLRRVGDVAAVGAVYHVPAGAHPEYPSVDVLESILTVAPSGRLYKALVESKKAASVSGAAFALHDPGVLLLIADVAKGNEPRDVLDVLLQVTEQVGTQGVTAEEVERARQRLLKQRELAAANSSGIAIELSEWAAQGDWRLYFLYRDRLEKVTPESVKQVAAKYLQRNNRTAGIYVPVKERQRVAVSATPDLDEMIGDYKGRQAISAGEEFDVSPKNIDVRTRRFQLPGGLKAAFLKKKTRGEAVHLRLTLRYGNVENLKGFARAADFLPTLMVRGTKNLTRQQLQDQLDKYRANLGASGSAGSATFSIRTQRTHLPAVLDLLRQVLREPTLPAAELDLLKQEWLASLEKAQSDPQALSIRSLRRKFRPYASDDPRYEPTIPEDIERVKAVSREKMQQLHSEYFGATVGELAVVGDFDGKQVEQLATAMLAGWQAAKPYEHIPQRGDFKVEATVEKIVTPDKANAVYVAGLVFPMTDADPDYPALVMGNHILGGSSLSSRLGNRVRQREGLSYGVFSHFQALALDERGSLTIMAISNPANVGKVQTAIREEIELLLKDGVQAKELEEAKSGFLQSQKVSRTDDGRLARILASLAHADRTMAFQEGLEQKIEAITPAEVQETLRKHFDPKGLTIVLAGDFEKGADTPKE